MKAKKAGIIVCIVFAVIFAAAGVVLMLLPEPYTPVAVGEEVRVSHSSGHIFFSGTLKNDSDEPLTITYLEIEVRVDGGTETCYTDEDALLAPGEEYDLEDLYVNSWSSPDYISQIKVEVNGVEYTVYSSSGRYFAWTVLAFLLTLVFVILGIVSIVGYVNLNKRYRQAETEIAAVGGDPVLAVGYYGRKGEAGKAAAKTALWALGGAASALLFGFGTYKVYGANEAKEFVVSDDGLYIGNPSKSKFDLRNMQFIPKNGIPDSEVAAAKKRVTMTNLATGEFFVFDLSSNNAVTAEALKARIENMLSSRQPVQEAAPAQEDSALNADGDDPFGE